MVDTGNHDRQQIREQCWLLLQVEREGLVVTAGALGSIPKSEVRNSHLDVRNPNNHILELVVFPSIR